MPLNAYFTGFSANCRKLEKSNFHFFGSYGWGDGERMRSWENRVKSEGAVLIGGEGVMANETPSDKELTKCAELGKILR